MSDTRIEWTDATWNPVTGCTKVSAGCKNCYAEAFANRQMGQWKGRAFTDVRCHEDRLEMPLHWKKPRRVFVNSMSDLFHPDVPDSFIDRVFHTMAWCRKHVYQVLTKRPERMRAYSVGFGALTGQERALRLVRSGIPDYTPTAYVSPLEWPLPNVWLGVSVEDQATSAARIPLLLQASAAVRFVSCEPLLGPVDLRGIWNYCPEHDFESGFCVQRRHEGVRWLDLVIIGGESGPKARPCRVGWIEALIAQSRAAGVSCFVKQLGTNPWWPDAVASPIEPALGKCNDPLRWPESLRVREMPNVAA
jgi:protein gp37